MSRNEGKCSAFEKPHAGALRPRVCGCLPIEENSSCRVFERGMRSSIRLVHTTAAWVDAAMWSE